MKRTGLAIGVLLLMIFPVTVAFANDAVYEIDELGLQICVPEDWSVITRDTSVNDPIFDALNVDKDTFLDYMEDHSMYFNSICFSPLSEIVVTRIEDIYTKSIYDLNLLDNAELNDLAQTVIGNEEAENMGIYYSDYTVYDHPQVRFLVLDLYSTQGESPSHGVQCSTVVNGVMISITMHSYEGEMTRSQMNLFQSIIDDTVFTSITEEPTEEPMEQPAVEASASFDGSSMVQSALIGGITGAAIAGVILLLTRRKKKESTDEKE